MNGTAVEAAPAYQDSLAHLRDELHCLDLRLAQAVADLRARRAHHQAPEYRGLYLSDVEIDDLLSSADQPPDRKQLGLDMQLAARRAGIQRRVAQSRAAGITLRLPHLATIFRLGHFEADALLLALASEFDLRYQKLFAYLQDDVHRKQPSVDLALTLFCPSAVERAEAREMLADSAPLFRSSLLLPRADEERAVPSLQRQLRIDGRTASFLLDGDQLDPRLVTPVPVARWVVPRRQIDDLILTDDTRTALERLGSLADEGESWLVLLHGPVGAGKKAAAEALCRERGNALLIVDLPALVRCGPAAGETLRSAFREALFYGATLFADGWHEVTSDPAQLSFVRAFEQEMERFPGLALIGGHASWQPSDVLDFRFSSIEMPMPDAQTRRRLWELCLGELDALGSAVDSALLAGAFRFTGGQIRQAAHQAESHARLRNDEEHRLTTATLLETCRVQATQHLVSFARQVARRRNWDDLVLPKDTLAQLREFCQHLRFRSRVYDDWGFDQRLSLGKGLIALFSGPSGTGKTLAVEILANDLGLTLYQVDLSAVVSKYIGETEKNLSRVFDDAQESNALLFFDEADALFGKRTEVKDAHDRYANIEVNYLLQRVETYEGVIILASNFSKNIDAAFLRRLHFAIEFPFPDEEHRRRIWLGMFPRRAPVGDDVDFEFLARKFKIAGGNIKNVALNAAFRAAEHGGGIQMEHVILALKREYQKLGKVCDRAEFERYFDLVR